MPIRRRAEETAKAVFEALGAPDPAHSKQVVELIEQAIIASYLEAAERCTTVVLDCCAEDRDKAHKIADEIRRANTALIANLSSLR